MMTTLFTACGKNNEQGTAQADTTPEPAAETPAPTATPKPAGEALPEARYYFSFDKADGTDKIQPSMKDSAMTPIVQPAPEKEVVLIDGVKGEALYCNGSYGYKIPEVNGVGETYSISFWVYARRFANYMPTVQYGPDMHGDVTGGQHYLNFTRAEWSGSGEYPCIWSYDQNGDEAVVWPNWFPNDGEGERLNQWLHLVLVVDENNTTDEGSNILGKLYLNGELFNDSVTLVTGTMAPSDNFDFLLGINYWDAYFKGGFDEVYIFDKVLTDGQVQTLYQDGNPQTKFVEPERIIVVTPEKNAIETIGSIDLKSEFRSDWTSSVELKDGESKKVKLHNWSSGLASKDNYAVVFSNVASEAHKDPKDVQGYNEYALIRADATDGGNIDVQYNYTWGNWNTWTKSAMVDANVTLTVSREGDTLKIVANNVDFNGTSNDMTAVIKTGLTAEDPCFFAITCENAYVDILSVKDATQRANAGLTVGTQDCTVPFWTAFSPVWAVPKGETRTFGFTNYTDGVNNWDTFIAILQSTPSGHAAKTAEKPDGTEGYKEYAVLRADNWGWGNGFANTDDLKSCDWNFESFLSDIDGAHISLTVTNNGETAEVSIVARTADNKEYHQNYTGIVVDGDLYLTFTCEKAYLVFDSEVVGSRDLNTPFWNTFADIMAVPKNGSKSVSFRNYTAGDNAWENFLVILQNTPAGHAAKTADNPAGEEGYMEYAVLRADNWGWGGGFANDDASKNCDWDWETFTNDINGANVDVTVYNHGDTAEVKIVVTTEDGRVFHQNYTNIAVDGDNLYLTFTLEKAYLVFNTNIVGATDNTTPFWTQFSPVTKVDNGETEYVSFTNYTDGAESWNNFLMVIQNTPTGHAAKTDEKPDGTEGYKEYAVLRADNWGWADGFANTDEVKNCDWNWDTFKNDMDGARVAASITNNDGIVDIAIAVTTASGNVYHQNYTVTAEADSVYYCLFIEKAHISIN